MTAKEINELKSELFTREQFLEALLREDNAIWKKKLNAEATAKDNARLKEVRELETMHTKFINKSREKLRKFYAPATVIDAE